MRTGIKQFKLSSVTTDMDRDKLDEMTIASVKRILEAESKFGLIYRTLSCTCLLIMFDLVIVGIFSFFFRECIFRKCPFSQNQVAHEFGITVWRRIEKL